MTNKANSLVNNVLQNKINTESIKPGSYIVEIENNASKNIYIKLL